MLGQLDDVSVEVFIASALAPELAARFVKDTSACPYCRCMSIFDVVDRESDLSAGSRLVLGRIESEVKVGPLSPGDFGMTPAYPPVVNPVVTRMKI
jgi:hypothetical protein